MIRIYNKNYLDNGYLKKFQDTKDAGIIYNPMPKNGLIFYVPLKENKNTANTGQTLEIYGTINYQQKDNIPCGYFNGSSYIDVNDNSLNFDNNDITISMWLNCNSNQEIFSAFGNISNSYNYGIVIDSYSSAIRILPNTHIAYIAMTYTFNTWINLIITLSNNKINTYINNQQMISDKDYNYSRQNGTMRIGGIYNNIINTCYFSSIRIYNRIITQSERASLSKEFLI